MRRRAAREAAFKLLFAADIGKTGVMKLLTEIPPLGGISGSNERFVKTLATGVETHLKEIDDIIARFSVDWSIDRMASTDRNILRLAIFEILFMEDIPWGVSINEAVELAKKYGDKDSGKFVNGILGSIVRALGKQQGTDSIE